MSRQDKATTERFTRTLRELVKRPENKTCADCKRNDPRWASWNLGVFLCIRCSGIHRGMGTHISKVKSVDLDVWTPEQMESIQKWGNHLANLYWEAHLKPGHVPPEHKMESFVRSKYESRRWALEGPPPSDPSVFEGRSASAQVASPQAAPPPAATRSTHAPSNSLSSRQAAAPITTRQPQPHQLLSTGYASRQAISGVRAVAAPSAPAQASTPPPEPKAPENDLFSLDFHAPSSAPPVNNASSSQPPKKDVKQDIMSLFSSAPVAAVPALGFGQGFGQFGAAASQASPWAGAQPQQQQVHTQPTSMMGTNGAGAWGVNSGWSGPSVPPAQGNLWGNPAVPTQPQQPNLFANSNDVWGSPNPVPPAGGNQDPFGSFATPASSQKKDDVFGDIWGGFK